MPTLYAINLHFLNCPRYLSVIESRPSTFENRRASIAILRKEIQLLLSLGITIKAGPLRNFPALDVSRLPGQLSSRNARSLRSGRSLDC